MAKWTFYIDGELVEEPIGFDAIEFTAQRMESHGIDQPFSTELTFAATNPGSRILKNYYDSQFINASVPFVIESDVTFQGSPWVFNGYINFAIYSEEKTCDQTGWTVTVGILEDDFREKFLSRQDVELDLLKEVDLDQNAINPLTLETIRLHCQELYLVAKAQNLDLGLGTIFPDQVGLPPFTSNPYQLPFYFDNSDFKGPFSRTFNPTGTSGSETNVLLVNNADETRTYQWTGRIFMNGFYTFADPTSLSALFQVVLVVYDTTLPAPYEVSVTTLQLSPSIPYNTGVNLDFTFDETVTLDPDQRATIQARWFAPTPIPNAQNNQIDLSIYECCLTISELNSSSATNCQGLYPFNFLNRVVEQMTGDSNALVSNFFEIGSGCQWNNLLTLGLFIRNAATVDEILNGCGDTETQNLFQIKTSWKSIFESLDNIFCLGWQFEQDGYGNWKIRVESREYFYDLNVEVARFQKVSQLKQYALSDKLVNNVICGYSDKWKNIAVSGIFEIHTERNYFIPNKARSDNSSVSLDQRSDIIASGYAIEFYRRLQFLRDDSGSSDRPNDYDIFIIWLNRDELTINPIEDTGYQFPDETGSVTFQPGTVSYGSNFIAESNSPIDRIFNVFHSPARVAARHWKWLGMHTFGLDVSKAKLFFQVGQYYTDYSSRIDTSSAPIECIEVLGDEALVESTNISPEILNDFAQEYILKPIGLDIEVPQSLCDFLAMTYPGNGFVQVESGGFKFYGFIQNASNKPQDPQSGMSSLTLYLSKTNAPDGDFNNDFSNDFYNGN
jgi:hypothetical protein